MEQRTQKRFGARRKRHKKRKKDIDPIKQQEIDEKVARIQSKRQEIINIVKNSLDKRRDEKLALKVARLQNELKAKRKSLKNAKRTSSETSMLKIREEMSSIVTAGINEVSASNVVKEKVKFDGKKTLRIKGSKYKVSKNLHLIGWGKEAMTMAAAFERIVGKNLKKGWLVVPRSSISMMWNYPEAFPKLSSRITYTEVGSEGQPDDKTVASAQTIIKYCKKLRKRDILVVMVSKDIDHLLCCPVGKISLQEKLRVLDRLKAANATPEELNVVRNKLSAIRGGQLARAAYPAKIIVLLTSAVSDDPQNCFTADGPCTYDPRDSTAYDILTKYDLTTKMSLTVRETLKNPEKPQAADKKLDEGKNYKFVESYVIACNADAINRMAAEAFKFGMFPVKLSSTCEGDARDLAQEYVRVASFMILAAEGKISKLEMWEAMKDSEVCPLTEEDVREVFPAKDKWGLGLCLLLGGRCVIEKPAEAGEGGPNQELALYFSLYWHLRAKQYPILNAYTVWFLGANSTGKDGNTSDAGAFGYKSLGTDVFFEYQKAKQAYTTAHSKWWKSARDKPREEETLALEMEAKHLEENWKKHAAILPDRVLEVHNTNLMFQCVNNGEDLIQLNSGNSFTFTDVGDVHVIRIVRFECNCDGNCQKGIDRVCGDLKCPAAGEFENQFKNSVEQYCCQLGKLKSH